MAHLEKDDAAALIARRHPSWEEYQRRWRFLQDSLEGGNRYRLNNYITPPLSLIEPRLWFLHGYDVQTSTPVTISYREYGDTNLVPHLSEMDLKGRDLYSQRLARTPVPSELRRLIGRHLARVYSKEVRRETTDPLLEDWWADVDGRGTTIDKWMRKHVGPLLLALGQIDLAFDHPAPPEGVDIRTRADALEYALGTCVGSIILPENMVWWERDERTGCYEEVLIYERFTDEAGGLHARWRHWTDTDSNAYGIDAIWQPERSYEHSFGMVPVRRIFDTELVRVPNVGSSRYEEVAELQKSIYNRKSELILGDIQHSHAVLTGPEEYVQGQNEIPVGPGGILPKKASQSGGSVSYEGWDYLDPPKGAQAELRQHILDDYDRIDVIGCLAKPAGAHTRGAVAQSGISKVMDDQSLVDLLSEVSETLADAERAILPVVLAVLHDGAAGLAPALAAEVTVVYPREFGLQGPADMAEASTEVAQMGEEAGVRPEMQKEIQKKHARLRMPGLSDERLKVLDEEIEAHVDEKADQRRQMAEGMVALAARRVNTEEGDEDEDEEGVDMGADANRPAALTQPVPPGGAGMWLGGAPA